MLKAGWRFLEFSVPQRIAFLSNLFEGLWQSTWKCLSMDPLPIPHNVYSYSKKKMWKHFFFKVRLPVVFSSFSRNARLPVLLDPVGDILVG